MTLQDVIEQNRTRNGWDMKPRGVEALLGLTVVHHEWAQVNYAPEGQPADKHMTCVMVLGSVWVAHRLDTHELFPYSELDPKNVEFVDV